MYDARGSSQMGGGNSNLIFGIAIIVVVAIAFCAVLWFPSPGKSESKVNATATSKIDHPILAELTDNQTSAYVGRLQSVAPKSAEKLADATRSALSSGSSKDELAFLVLSSFDQGEFEGLAQADVEHLDRLVSHIEKGLSSMVRGNSKWCWGTTYESISQKGPERALADLSREFGYKSDLYNWSLKLNLIALDGVEQGRKLPVRHGSLTSQDEAALQGAMMGMLANPQIMKLMMLQGASRAEMERAAAGLNFCSLGQDLLNVYQGLPKETRGRLWAEAARQADSNDFERQLGQFARF